MEKWKKLLLVKDNSLCSGKKLLIAHPVYPADHTVSGIGQRFILY
jgi:hypothetical protein